MANPPTPNVGDFYDLAQLGDADCPAVYRGEGGLLAMCVLDAGHGGDHVAVGEEGVVVEVWPA